VGVFREVKINACEDESKIARIDNTSDEYQRAGPSQ
jgi:hypothetical protein